MTRERQPKYRPLPPAPKEPEIPVWKDISSYSRLDTDRSVKTVELVCNGIRIVVTRHKDFPGKWVLRCDPFYQIEILESTALEAAKKEAGEMVLFQVNSIRKRIERVLYPNQMPC